MDRRLFFKSSLATSMGLLGLKILGLGGLVKNTEASLTKPPSWKRVDAPGFHGWVFDLEVQKESVVILKPGTFVPYRTGPATVLQRKFLSDPVNGKQEKLRDLPLVIKSYKGPFTSLETGKVVKKLV